MKSYYGNIREEELKNKVGKDWFDEYDWTGIVGNIDFSVALKAEEGGQKRLWDETEFLLWAEAKQGTKHDIYESFVQLILTIGKAHTIDRYLPPIFLGAFDAEKIAFIPYNAVMEVFSQNDFNWNVTPSNHTTKEFIQLHELVKNTLEENSYLYHYDTDVVELRNFIRNNFRLNKESVSTIRINKNNFTHIYLKWLRDVKPSIAMDWDEAKKEDILDADFYLADILSEDNATIKEKLFVLLQKNHYKYNITRKATGAISFDEVAFKDGQKAHTRFWKRYTRPPKEEYWDYIVNRRDLLVPQDIRERKGSFFTPSQWVELSQEYIARELGENWQDEYYVWDCCAGTGNLLAGLTNKFNIYASTLDSADVRVMKDLIANNSLNLLDSHVFQFDFLNDDFTKLPQSLQDIINDPEKRKKLVIYINPPYAEAGSSFKKMGTGEHKSGVARNNNAFSVYGKLLGKASNELFAQFLIRMYKEIEGCIIANFSTLKILQAPNFVTFRNIFKAKLCQLFVVPANTFDNVQGSFPIGFHIWHTIEKNTFEYIEASVYDKKGNFVSKRKFHSIDTAELVIGKWLVSYNAKEQTKYMLGDLNSGRNDVQHNNLVYISHTISIERTHSAVLHITQDNLIVGCVYLAVRQCIEATWLNDRDQFFYPKDTWKDDLEFQSDCLAFTLFHGQNKITMSQGTNHWIPFTEEEVGAKERFDSHFMTDYISGKNCPAPKADLFSEDGETSGKVQPIVFSLEATAVMDAGRELWRYYHKQPIAKPNAAFYDIRLHFQGTNAKGNMNPDSTDEEYTRLIKHLRSCLKTLAKKIEPKVYEHGFLMQ